MASRPPLPPSSAPLHIRVNGVRRDLAPGTTLASLLADLGADGPQVAVAVNAAVVPRAEHPGLALAEADEVEVIEPVGGG